MTSHLLCTTALVALLALPSSAAAQAPRPRPPSTFFIVEGQIGAGIGSVFAEDPDGLATRITIGGGGKLVGLPTRFYGVLNISMNSYSGVIRDEVNHASTSRSLFGWSAGLRTLTPIAPQLRLLAELSLGQVSVDSAAELYGSLERYQTVDQSFLVELGFGLQWRLNLNFSLGAKVDLSFPTNLEDYDLLGAIAGAKATDVGSFNRAILVSLTLHL